MDPFTPPPQLPATNAPTRTVGALVLLVATVTLGTWAVRWSMESALSQVSVPLSTQGIHTELPVAWGDLGAQMVTAGVIDKTKFEALYVARGGLTTDEAQLVFGETKGNLVITRDNASLLLNLLWALGLSNENDVLINGPMSDQRYGNAGGFASTGGWTIATGDAMDHFAQHTFVTLTEDEQQRVERVAQNIYRPCCDNSTYFPDCNHGMAMLGLLELMAHQGRTEEEMYATALIVNAYWFPDTYATIEGYFAAQGMAWEQVDPRDALGQNVASASGYARVVASMQERKPGGGSGGGGCSV